MPPINDVIAFAIASFLIIIIPGPSVLFTIGRGISFGKKAAEYQKNIEEKEKQQKQ